MIEARQKIPEYTVIGQVCTNLGLSVDPLFLLLRC